MGRTSTKDGIKFSSKASEHGNINLSPKPDEKRAERKAQAKPQSQSLRPATKIDIDGTLVGKRVVLHVHAGNMTKFIIGTIITMGSFWVVVKVEKTDIAFVQDIAYVNKAYIIMYAPLPNEAGQGEQK